MPIDLVLVRHGQSESNAARRLSEKGDHTIFDRDEFAKRHTTKIRLTDRGIKQAKTAGLWIKNNIGPNFDRYYTSEYLRAMETAYLLNLPEALWYPEFYLGERDWGSMGMISEEERATRFKEELKLRSLDSFHWTPTGGESMIQLCLRLDRVLHTLHRECSDKRVIIVCHGEVMWGFKIRLERMSPEQYKELSTSSRSKDRISNCQIIHYTRRCPDRELIAPHYLWMRSVCPWDFNRSRNHWQPIERKKYSNEDLLQTVNRFPRILS